jgi:hypothetical protein
MSSTSPKDRQSVNSEYAQGYRDGFKDAMEYMGPKKPVCPLPDYSYYDYESAKRTPVPVDPFKVTWGTPVYQKLD